MGQDLVEIHPRELQFTFEVKKQSSCSVQLVNKSNEYVAFKVKTTSPKRYCVRPNTGVILPRATCDFVVTMQAQRTAPPDMQLKDKFLVQTTVVPYGTSDEDIVPAFFSKETGRYIEESKLRVVLVSAPQPIVEQPVNGVPIAEAPVEVPILRETLNVVNQVPDVVKEIPAPTKEIPPSLKETLAIFSETPSPVKESSPIVREVPVPLKEAAVILTEAPPVLKDDSEISAGSVLPLKETTATLEESPPLKEPPAPKEVVILGDRGFVSVENRHLSHVTEDVQNLKSKLNNLNSKLEEAEKMITKLREESRTTIQERDKLQQEMVLLRRKGTSRQAGFPLLFVVYVALLGMLLGYLLRL